MREVPLPVLPPALVLIQLRVAAAPRPSGFGKAAARSPGQWDVLAFGRDGSAFLLALVTAAVGHRTIRQSDTESSEQSGDCGWSGVKDRFFLIGVARLRSELLPPPPPPLQHTYHVGSSLYYAIFHCADCR